MFRGYLTSTFSMFGPFVGAFGGGGPKPGSVEQRSGTGLRPWVPGRSASLIGALANPGFGGAVGSASIFSFFFFQFLVFPVPGTNFIFFITQMANIILSFFLLVTCLSFP